MRLRGILAAAALACAAGSPAEAAPLAVSVGGSDGGPVAQAVAYATAVGARGAGPAPKPAIVDQIDKEFVPFVLPVQTGTPVSFPNRDQIRHHVYSFSPAKTFELKLYSGVPAKPVVFDQPGPVALGCNIHDWMVGYVYVVDSPWFARTAKSGTATLDLPPGEYDVRVWHPWQRAEAPAKRLKVEAAGGELAFRLDLAPPPPRPAAK